MSLIMSLLLVRTVTVCLILGDVKGVGYKPPLVEKFSSNKDVTTTGHARISDRIREFAWQDLQIMQRP
jgi:hypothetical protein